MKIYDLNARRISFDKIFVSWAVIGCRKDTYFKVYRRFNSEEYSLVGEIIGTTVFVDTDVKIKRVDTVLYRVESSDSVEEINIRAHVDPFLMGIASDNHWRLNNVTSLNAKAFCNSKNDTTCTECYSVELQKRISGTCNTCDGSGRMNSLKGPISIKIALIDVFRTKEIIGNVERDTAYFNCWTGNYPDLDMNDYIFLDGKKYTLYSKPTYQEHQATNGTLFLTMQKLQLKLMDDDFMPMLDELLEG